MGVECGNCKVKGTLYPWSWPIAPAGATAGKGALAIRASPTWLEELLGGGGGAYCVLPPLLEAFLG